MRYGLKGLGATALGLLFALGTLHVLLSDMKSPAEFGVDHLLTILVLIGTIASGHLV
jgi:hypothetical protein